MASGAVLRGGGNLGVEHAVATSHGIGCRSGHRAAGIACVLLLAQTECRIAEGEIAAMKLLVIGAGMMGSAAAFDMARSSGVESVTLADADGRRAKEAAARV